jgi:predicted GIY-YIG superfamily endonuclease
MNASKPHVVYEFYDGDGAPVYVGCTVDLAARLVTHQASEMWREVVEVHTHRYDSRDEAMSREAQLIRELQPRWNFQHTERASEAARERHRRRVEAGR